MMNRIELAEKFIDVAIARIEKLLADETDPDASRELSAYASDLRGLIDQRRFWREQSALGMSELLQALQESLPTVDPDELFSVAPESL